MKNKWLLLFFIAVFMTACSDEYYEHSAIIEINNQSSHTVELADFLPEEVESTDQKLITPNAILATGEQFVYSLTLWKSRDYLGSISRCKPCISFDNKYRVWYNDEGLPFVEQVVMQEEENGDPRYIFTITDADYDYAVEFGFKLVKPTE
jgi:hypothetical protein